MNHLSTSDLGRRDVLCAALASLAASGLESGAAKGAASAASAPPRSSNLPLRSVRTDDVEIAYADLGPRGGDVVILLHGWPYDIHSFTDAARRLAVEGCRVVIPYLRGFGGTRFLSESAMRNGQPAAVALDTVAMMDALRIKHAFLAGFDWGARSADIIAALWPERCKGLVAVSGYLIGSQAAGSQPLAPQAELQWWYQFYFATERGRQGYQLHRNDFARLIWSLASPQWRFDNATFQQSAAAFDNPDHVDVVIHNYRWRLGLAEGEKRYDAVERQLALAPPIRVPSITLEGDANGAPHPPPAAYASKFTGRYAHRDVRGGIGHNLPQEAPAAFAQAVLDVRKGDF